MPTRPFDLAKALSGDPVETRIGEKPAWWKRDTQLPDPKNLYLLDNRLVRVHDDGLTRPPTEGPNDLVMSDTGDDVWAGVYKIGTGAPFLGAIKRNSAGVDTEQANNPTWTLWLKLSGKQPLVPPPLP